MPSYQKALVHLCRVDPRLARVIDRVGPCTFKPAPMPGLFHALCESITYQQLSGKAAATIFGRVQQKAGEVLRPERVAALGDDVLRACGISRPKLAAMRDLTARALAGELPRESTLATLDNEEIIQRLCIVRGIGRWTAEMILMFRLGRQDVLPVTDYGIRKGFTLMAGSHKLASPERIARHGRLWAPWRTVAAWYLWRLLEVGME